MPTSKYMSLRKCINFIKKIFFSQCNLSRFRTHDGFEFFDTDRTWEISRIESATLTFIRHSSPNWSEFFSIYLYRTGNDFDMTARYNDVRSPSMSLGLAFPTRAGSCVGSRVYGAFRRKWETKSPVWLTREMHSIPPSPIASRPRVQDRKARV